MKFYNIDFVNKNWFNAFLSGITLDWLVDAKFGKQKIWRMFKRMINFALSASKQIELKEGEIRLIDDQCILTRGNLSVCMQLSVPYIMGYERDARDEILARQEKFFKQIRVIGRFEMYYVNREATVEDYLPYVYYINENFKKDYSYRPQINDRDRQLLELEDNISSFLKETNVQVMDAYLIVSEPCISFNRHSIQSRIAVLDKRIIEVANLARSTGFTIRMVRDKALREFVSHNIACRYETGAGAEFNKQVSTAVL